ncbi:putative chaperone protein DNAj [Trypanosoma vivax]|nr:putative chaperone protein DNAj [Trypanosoma vivax]
MPRAFSQVSLAEFLPLGAAEAARRQAQFLKGVTRPYILHCVYVVPPKKKICWTHGAETARKGEREVPRFVGGDKTVKPAYISVFSTLFAMRRAALQVVPARAPFKRKNTFASGGYGGSSPENRQNLLEEEEFRAMEAARDEFDMLPVSHRLAAKADALDMELKRLSFFMFEKPQLIVDTRAATLTRRPASVVRVLRSCKVTKPCQGRPSTWSPPVGSSSTIVQICGAVRRLLKGEGDRPRSKGGTLSATTGAELATLTTDIDYMRRMQQLHALNFYSRLNMTPRRHIFLAFYTLLWNTVVAVQNALGCILFGAIRGVRDHGLVVGLSRGVALGCVRAAQFMACGLLLSPLVHIPSGLCNTVYGVWNAFSGRFFFEACSGRWQYCCALDCAWLRHDLLLERRAIRSVGRMEFRRKHMQAEEKWRDRLASMGFSIDKMTRKVMSARQPKGRGNNGDDQCEELENPYEVLQVPRSATQAQIKTQYKRLAKIFHPDVTQRNDSETERLKAQRKFESISQAYQILSNPEKRQSYDIGGARALRLHESKMGRFMSRTPEEIVQGVFGGEPFRQRVLGSLLRSHWHLRNEAQVSVSLYEFEQLQCLRCRELTAELARILDVHAQAPPTRSASPHSAQAVSEVAQSVISKLDCNLSGGTNQMLSKHKNKATSRSNGTGASSPYVRACFTNEHNCFSRDFVSRCDRYTRRLSEACFGRELMYEVGQSYIISSQRFLGVLPFYAPKVHVYKKIFSGADRIFAAFREKIDSSASNNPEWLARKVMVEYFNMEFDSVVADASIILRFAAQNVLQDVTVTEEQRLRRCYALWYLGEEMMRKGTPWSAAGTSRSDDGELMAYLQQAANSAATTSQAEPF